MSHSPIRTVARQKLERRIVQGDLAPGTQLKLAELSEELAVGLTPLREALIEVERDGLVEHLAGRGFFVSPLTLQEAGELYPMIWTLEGLAVRLTPRYTPSHLARLRDINARFTRGGDDPVAALDLDAAWHRALVERCGNRLLLDTLAGVKRRSRRYEFAFQRAAKHLPISVVHHEHIADALAGDDRDRAVTLVEENWAPGPRFLGEWLRATSVSPAQPQTVAPS